MIEDQEEKNINCPYCGEPISVLVDPSVSEQTYIEDCSVCCQPMELQVAVDDDGDSYVEVRADSD